MMLAWLMLACMVLTIGKCYAADAFVRRRLHDYGKTLNNAGQLSFDVQKAILQNIKQAVYAIRPNLKQLTTEAKAKISQPVEGYENLYIKAFYQHAFELFLRAQLRSFISSRSTFLVKCFLEVRPYQQYLFSSDVLLYVHCEEASCCEPSYQVTHSAVDSYVKEIYSLADYDYAEPLCFYYLNKSPALMGYFVFIIKDFIGDLFTYWDNEPIKKCSCSVM
jgi:hypothetical protein